jgi:hypothetical protein
VCGFIERNEKREEEIQGSKEKGQKIKERQKGGIPQSLGFS